MTPTIAVVIPCRNAAAYLGETLDSVLGQVGVTCDVVVVDDGSEDESAGVVRAVGGDRVRLVQQASLGASRARTVGTAAARGPFVQYLDADDVLAPGTLARRAAALEDSGAEVAYTDWVRWERQAGGTFADGDVLARRLGDRPDVELVADAWWPPGALLYRRSIVNRIGPWREDLPVIQDARFLLDAALCAARFVHVPGVGLRYRVHGPTSLSRRDPHAFLVDCLHSTETLDARWAQEGTMDEPRRRALVRAYAIVARGLFAVDRPCFDRIVTRLRTLDPGFLPEGPPALRALSRLVGYPGAEQVACWWRGLKSAVRPANGTPRASAS